ncbi:MAG: PIN domain-containing protein [Lyngbya sp. HA4199-MV5]|jgi:predicted nucleic acid-binding protein|nr:PIN domain-containing protein [Lyngbya sp. HA4199-MV5]
MRIYLDTSALNRLFDDRSQMRIALEAKAMESILLLIETGAVEFVASEALAYEISRNPYPDSQAIALGILEIARTYQTLTPELLFRGQQLEAKDRIGQLDALHIDIACAEILAADYFITCDDRLVRRYKGNTQVCNPVDFILSVTAPET